MTQVTPNAGLPCLEAAQSMKHLTHNEALAMIDGLIRLVVSATLDSPPANPPDGAVFEVGPAASGDFAGQAGRLALFGAGAGYVFVTPREGWLAWFAESANLHVRRNGVWQVFSPTPSTVDMLGIGASADQTNRLSVASPASLFSHAGNSHRLMVNKAAAADTASVLLARGFSTRAEIGLCGNDNLSFKVSGDGTTFRTALEIAADGVVRLPQRPVVRAHLGEMNLFRNNTNTGFGVLAVNQGGFALGDPVPSGVGQKLVVPATGLYHVVTNMLVTPTPAATNTVVVNGVASHVANIKLDANQVISWFNSVSSLIALNAGDQVWMQNTGNTEYRYGSGKTELMLALA